MSDKISSKILNLPNIISLSRILLGILLLFLIALYREFVIGAFILAIAGITDFLDGYIARHTNKVSELGKALDPVADRALLIAVSLGVIIAHIIPFVIVAIVLARELVMSISTIALAVLKAKRIDVLWIGKFGTLLLMTSIPLLMLGYASGNTHTGWHAIFYWPGITIILAAIVVSWIATFSYLPSAINSFRKRDVLS